MTIQEIIEKYEVEMEKKRIEKRDDGLMTDFPNHWKVLITSRVLEGTLKGKKRTMTLNYSGGSAIHDIDLPMVLKSLLTDLTTSEYYDFVEFCEEFGYGSDVRQAKLVFDTMKKQNERTQKLFPDIEIQDLEF